MTRFHAVCAQQQQGKLLISPTQKKSSSDLLSSGTDLIDRLAGLSMSFKEFR